MAAMSATAAVLIQSPSIAPPCLLANSFVGKNAGLPSATVSKPARTAGSSKSLVCVRASGTPNSGSVQSSSYSREFALQAFTEGRGFKVISGLHNFNSESVAAVVAAAEAGGATHVDIACDPELVRLALSLTKLPVCVSAVEPELFVPAVEAGAHMVELGNFDGFYKSGRVFSAAEVLDLTIRTRELLPSVVLCVTVPHTLPLVEQVQLAEELAAAGADLIQTEGGTSSDPSASGIQGCIQKAVPTLAAAHAISRAVRIPVLCASGLTDITVPMAIAAGAAGVGIGSAINKLNDSLAMVAAVRSISLAVETSQRSSTTAVPQGQQIAA
eukprot:TRINITY_DN7784_c0_g1_i1.p1 TRINITY_DN7784_c0_g1~~TRINITY_DN7784_c0_g1_i1.p1  ORF type:complete len:362 (+),score=52.85 TRINITY_DN7784_c0_g1_i1:105-1088(+)